MSPKKKNYAVIKLEPDKKPVLIKLDKKELSLDFSYEHCGCDVITIANTYDYNSIFKTDYSLICDDNGLMVEHPIINPLASCMYSFPQTIAGTCLVVRQSRSNEEPDIYALDIDECNQLFSVLTATFEFLKMEGVIK